MAVYATGLSHKAETCVQKPSNWTPPAWDTTLWAGRGQNWVWGFILKEEELIWGTAELLGGDGSPTATCESQEERSIETPSFRTWRETNT